MVERSGRGRRVSDRKMEVQMELLKVIAEQNHEKLFEYNADTDKASIYMIKDGSFDKTIIYDDFSFKIEEYMKFCPNEDVELFKENFNRCVRKPSHATFEMRLNYKRGRLEWVRVFLASIDEPDGNVKFVAGRIASIQKEKDAEIEIRRKAENDALTGLYNHTTFEDLCEKKLREYDGEVIFVMLDVDDFKIINDTLGHNVGDFVLGQTGYALRLVTLDSGYAGRLGGDEFFILTEDIPDEQQLRLFLKAMLSQLRYNQIKKLKNVRFTLSMGISQYPQAGNKFDDLFKLADKALYIAKDKGKNRYIIYRPQLHDSIDVIGRQTETGGYPVYIKALKDVVRNIIVNKCNDIKAILEEIKTAFSLGAAVVYSMTDYKAIVYTDGCPEGLLDVAFMGSDSYKALLAVDNVLVLNNLSSIEREDESIYTKLASTGCCSYISIQLPEAHMPEYIIAFYMLGMKHKWGNVEIDYLTILAEAVYSAFKNDKQK